MALPMGAGLAVLVANYSEYTYWLVAVAITLSIVSLLVLWVIRGDAFEEDREQLEADARAYLDEFV